MQQTGWRAWRRDDAGLLWPPFPQSGTRPTPWEPGVRNYATCRRSSVLTSATDATALPHPAEVPAEQCVCGIRVMRDRAELIRYVRRVRHLLRDPSGRGIVVGEVAYGGDVYPGGPGDAAGALRVAWAELLGEPVGLPWSGPTSEDTGTAVVRGVPFASLSSARRESSPR